MKEWIEVAHKSDCPPQSSLELVVEDRVIALYNINGTFYALDGVCPHQGGPLGKGRLDGCVVTCPWHGRQFDIRTGADQLNSNIRQPVFDVRVEGERVLLRIA
jgi:nitrite reductase/ring-hydroxylating ferredoxin subunit